MSDKQRTAAEILEDAEWWVKHAFAAKVFSILLLAQDTVSVTKAAVELRRALVSLQHICGLKESPLVRKTAWLEDGE